jgi:N-dimethylarginine dimethylaminohydrolase
MKKSNDSFGVDSEFKSLKAVLLFQPGEMVEYHHRPEQVLHRKPVDFEKLNEEYQKVIAMYHKLNVKTYFVESKIIDREDKQSLLNMMYTRDVLFMTPKGAIIGRMGKEIRRPETIYAARALEKNGIPVLGKIHGKATFEGADALWLKEKLVMVGVGKRTNQEGYQQFQEILNTRDVECISVPFNQEFPQHLLGQLQLVDSNLALIRESLMSSLIIEKLEEYDYKIVRVPENQEVKEMQAMNIVTIKPREIIMPLNCPQTKKIFKEAGIKVAGEVQIDQLINGGGGLACATAPIERGNKN